MLEVYLSTLTDTTTIQTTIIPWLIISLPVTICQGQSASRLTCGYIDVMRKLPVGQNLSNRKVKIEEKSKGCFTRSLRVPGLEKVRLVISFENPELTGT
jgi:hypothetical protein